MPLPRCLYKYKSLSSDKNVAHAKDILVNNRLYFAAAESFNDPFEGRVTFSFSKSPVEKFDFLRDHLGVETHALSVSHASNWARRVLENNVEHTESQIRDFLCDAFRRKAGLCTLSEKKDDILMWSHYADSHKGICIEFEPRTSAQIEWFENAVPVRYQSNFPANDFYKRSATEADAIAAMATKSVQWAYEKEWRLLRGEPGPYALPQGVISGVVLGYAISDEHRKLVNEWATLCSPPPSVYAATIKPDAYALDIVLV